MSQRKNIEGRATAFRPVNDAHAIVEAAVFFEFTPPFTQDVMQNFDTLKIELSEKFPTFHPIMGSQIIFDSEAQTQSVEPLNGGFELRTVDKWVVRITPHIISIHCLD